MFNDFKNLQEPASFTTSWAEAEGHIVEYLAKATGAEIGKSAFIGFNPGIINCWYFNFTNISIGQVLYSQRQPYLCIPAYVELAYQKRADLQATVMEIVRALPAHNFGNVQQIRFREDGINEIVPDVMELKNESQGVPVYTIRLVFDVVFYTGDESC